MPGAPQDPFVALTTVSSGSSSARNADPPGIIANPANQPQLPPHPGKPGSYFRAPPTYQSASYSQSISQSDISPDDSTDSISYSPEYNQLTVTQPLPSHGSVDKGTQNSINTVRYGLDRSNQPLQPPAGNRQIYQVST